MKMNAASRRRMLFVFVLLGGFSRFAAAAEEIPGITVAETGVVDAMPDVVEIATTVGGNAVLGNDAILVYRDNKRRVTDSLNALKLNGLSVSSAGISVSSDAEAVRTRQSEEANSADKVAVQERLTIKLSGINTMDPDEILQSIIRIVDTVKDAGMTPDVGARAMIQMQYDNSTPVALATFKVSNSDALRRQAYETALKKVRTKAEHLAGLAGVTLGDIVSIRDTPADDDVSQFGAYAALIDAPKDDDQYGSIELHSIHVAVKLHVKFAIEKKD